MSDRDLDKIHVEFFTEARKNERKSAEKGRPVFDDVEKFRVRWVGDRNRVLVGFAHQPTFYSREHGRHISYAERFPKIYEAFKASAAAAEPGTPLAVLPGIPESKLAELKAQNVRTVENLAALADRTLTKLGPGFREFRDQAQAYLARVSDDAATTKLEARIRELEAMLAQDKAEPAEGDRFDDMSDDALRGFIEDRTGASPRKNAARDKLLAAARECADMPTLNEAAA